MEKSNKIERSEAWNNIYEVLARLDLKENTGDCLDRPSAATELEQLFLKLLPIQNVVGSALKDDERVHYEALQDCCKGILKVVDSGKVPQRGIMGLRLLMPK